MLFNSYLYKNYHGWGDMIIANTLRTRQTYCHKNGWLEVLIKIDPERIESRIDNKVKDYAKRYMSNRHPSDVRKAYLKTLVEKLSQNGKVFMVRIPVHNRMRSLENEFDDTFSDRISELVNQIDNVFYLDYSEFSDEYQYWDGNHLTRESAIDFSNRLSRDISSILFGASQQLD